MPFRAYIEKGNLTFPSVRASIRWQVWKEAHDGARVIIHEDKDDRSLSTLRMYRAWLSNVAANSGNNEEELHEFLLDRCALRTVVKIKGPKGEIEVEQKKRTSGGHSLSMNQEEMSEYMNRCAELTGYPLPTKEELEAMGYVSSY